MYEFIKGTLVEITEEHAILEAGGVGYKIAVPVSFRGHAPALGHSLALYISYIIREQSHSLVGFVSRAERDLFEILIAVSGVGPKTALNVIGHMGLLGVQQAVSAEQSASFVKVPGIGKKTAERLLMELKGKIAPVAITEPVVNDAVHALISLGYSHPLAYQAIQNAEKELGSHADLSKLISCALRLASTKK